MAPEDRSSATMTMHRRHPGRSARNAEEYPLARKKTTPAPNGVQKKIQQALGERLKARGRVSFLVSPEVLGGIELKAGGYKIAWSLRDFLDSLAASLSEAFEGAAQAARAGEEKAEEEAAPAEKLPGKKSPRKAGPGKAPAKKPAFVTRTPSKTAASGTTIIGAQKL